MKKLSNLNDVVDWRLCLGCGACAYICPDHKVLLVDVEAEGIRPSLRDTNCGDCTLCMDVCPGLGVDYRPLARNESSIRSVYKAFGPVLEIWEASSTDQEIRFKGASGGVITALSLFCIQAKNMGGVLHIGQAPDDPTRNKTYLSSSRSDLLSRVGSRYSAASVCDSLKLIEDSPVPCAFVGLPSEVAALRKAEQLRPSLRSKVGLAISFFCAGAPARKGTLKLLEKLGVPLERLENVRYRGAGWPGMFSTRHKGQSSEIEHITYQESWAFLQGYRPISTHLFPDGSGEGADISCGDPWYRAVQVGEAGSSLVVLRTELGRQLFYSAVSAGYIQGHQILPKQLFASQRNLVHKRGAIWGRLLALALLGIPRPKHLGFSLFSNWLGLPFVEKVRSVSGTLRRAVSRKYYKPNSRVL